QQCPLSERLADQAEVELLEVAQTAVDELARPRRCTRAEVPRLDQADRQTARRRVERGPGAHDPAADHEHLEFACHERLKRGRALVWAKPAGTARYHNQKIPCSPR